MSDTLTREKYLSPIERDRLLKMLDEEAIVGRAKGRRLPVRDAFAFRLAIVSGLRASELADLEVRDVSLARGQPPRLHVRHGKGDKERHVPLPSAMRAVIRQHLEWLAHAGLQTDANAPLIPGRTGKPMTRSALWKRWTAALRRAGIDHKPLHSSRHTCGLTLYRSSKDLLLVQRLLGHAKPATTLIYSHVLDEDVAAAQDAAWSP